MNNESQTVRGKISACRRAMDEVRQKIGATQKHLGLAMAEDNDERSNALKIELADHQNELRDLTMKADGLTTKLRAVLDLESAENIRNSNDRILTLNRSLVDHVAQFEAAMDKLYEKLELIESDAIAIGKISLPARHEPRLFRAAVTRTLLDPLQRFVAAPQDLEVLMVNKRGKTLSELYKGLLERATLTDLTEDVA
ncbi:hypothetical protein EZV61_03460 [Corallincola luteus]|uniref:Uncharacterized protein n=1 Tax=Corallincola luteus TaxID=1775177 RepID=A0ABY2AQ42_9GAMM|nr:hypothetical protein [Corallincola luteus]TCI05034.1 hypothetical protein EZV61_03460 [Corallincola luteus]